jgi:hypothetical protein
MSKSGWIAGVGIAIAMSLTHPVGADAQSLRFTPWLGLYAPTTDIGSVQAVEVGKQQSTFAFGGDLDIGGSTFLGLRAGASFATTSDVPIEGVGCIACSTRRNVFALTGGVVLRPMPMPLIRPYATAGAGIKWYDFNHDGVGVNALLNDQERFTFNIGAGVLLMPDSPIGLSIEVADYMSRFDFEGGESSTQHDLFLKLGLSFAMGDR